MQAVASWTEQAPWRAPALILLGSFGLAALSLVGREALAFDPVAWLIWGEQLTRLELDTDAGPSWKPLTVALAAPLTLAGDAALQLWLLFARAAAVLAVFAVADIGRRLGGAVVGVIAAALLLASPWWWYNAALGNSEGLLAAAIGWAAVAHLAGRHRLALLTGLAAATIRPEVALFFGAYCLHLWLRHPFHRAAAAAAVGMTGFAWLAPDLLGGGGALRAAEAAHGWASPGSAFHADIPVLAVLADALGGVTLPALLAVVAAVVLRPRPRWRAPESILSGLSAAYIALIAAMTALGFAGNPRYLVPALALLTPVAALGAVRVARRAAPSRRSPRVAAAAGAVLTALVVLAQASTFRAAAADVSDRVDASTGLTAALARAGGPERLRACGHARTSEPWRALVAYRLDLPFAQVTSAQHPQSAVLSPPRPPAPPRRGSDRRLLARASGWAIWDCREVHPDPAAHNGDAGD